jgi:hypothetical protein
VTHALTVLLANPDAGAPGFTGDPDEGGQVALARLAVNHNETVLRLA